ncbi:MAG: aminotransferase class I/II-fold pyridoxal phosphate-dependent enzyme, partial [Lachnospiraceae bacterium]|nr:aminotransferase class I/II-fold pyridoxal phosphate-dependent enzyme [Lachnospiraceae bacterium]
TMLERRGRDAIAVDLIGDPDGCAPAGPKEGFDAIPMWVADMSFTGCPAVTQAVVKRAEHPSYGYFRASDEYYDSIIRWQETRNGVKGLERKHIGYENGVLGGLVSVLNVLCSRGDNVLLQSPTYIGFTHVLENNGYNIVLNPMICGEDGWRLDLEDMERKIIENRIHAAIFCSPHNPCGRVWTLDELQVVLEIFERHDVWIISDEIWSDIILNGHRHIPLQSVNDYARTHTAALYAPSKTFNLAGLVGSYHIIYNDTLRERVEKESSLCGYNSMNVLSMHALIGAYSDEGMSWADELCFVLSENVNRAYRMIAGEFEGITLEKPEGTYMLFLHCEDWCRTHDASLDELLKRGTDVGVCWQDGRPFNDPFGIRMNLALPRKKMEEAFKRLKEYVFND